MQFMGSGARPFPYACRGSRSASSQDGASRGGIRSRGTRGGRGESTAGFVWAACARFAANRKAGFRRVLGGTPDSFVVGAAEIDRVR